MWSYNYTYTPEEEYLMHYGVKGMKWDPEKRKKLNRFFNAGPKAARSRYHNPGIRSRSYTGLNARKKLSTRQRLRLKKNRYTQPVRNRINSVRYKASNRFKKAYRKYSTAEGRKKAALSGVEAVKRGVGNARKSAAKAGDEIRNTANEAAKKAKKYVKQQRRKKAVKTAKTAGKLLMKGYKAYRKVSNRKKKKTGPEKGYYSKASR